MQTPTTHPTAEKAWTFDEYLDYFERGGSRTMTIDPPFSPDERALARAAAEAWYFWHFLTELPARAPHNSLEHGCFFFGIHRVNERRHGTWPRGQEPRSSSAAGRRPRPRRVPHERA